MQTETEKYLIADSKARVAALLRAQDDKTRERIRTAIQRNSRDIKTKDGASRGKKSL